MNSRNVIFVVITVIGVILDQATKWWIVNNVALGTGEIVVFEGFLSIVHAQNPGAAFGMLRGFEYRHLVFVLFTVIAGGVILDLFRKLPTDDKFMSVSLGLIFSGAIGNAIDRVRYQVVTDFIRVYTDQPALKQWLVETFGTYEWPSFNVADAALVVGVIMFLLHHLFVGEAEAEPPAKPPEVDEDEPTEVDTTEDVTTDVTTDSVTTDFAAQPESPST